MYETMKIVFMSYLENHGYLANEELIDGLVEIYLDCQDWESGEPVTGVTSIEMYDWIKHTSEVDRLVSEMSVTHAIELYISCVGLLRQQRNKGDCYNTILTL